MKRMYIQPESKVVCMKCKVSFLEGSPISVNFDDQRPTKGITGGRYASEGDDFGDARSREFDWEDSDE